MRRSLPRIAAVLTGLICAAMIFFPWDTFARATAARVTKAAADNGIWLTTRGFEVNGTFTKNFVLRSVKADLQLMRFGADEVTITQTLLSALFPTDKKFHVQMGRGALIPVMQVPLEWDRGSADALITDDLLRIENISITGKISVMGTAEFSRTRSTLTRVKMLIRVPPEIERTLDAAAKMRVMPLRKVKDGEWRLEI